MSRCKTCKHWETGIETRNWMPGLGWCRQAPILWAIRGWVKAEGRVVRVIQDEYKTRLAFVHDSGEECYPSLLTLPDFGCVQHEPKEERG